MTGGWEEVTIDGVVRMVTKLWGNGLGHPIEKTDLMPGVREDSGTERADQKHGRVRKCWLEMPHL